MKPGKRVYITVPREKLVHHHEQDASNDHEHESHAHDEFIFDPSIPLPVELLPGETEFDPQNLNIEMILSGILMELAENPECTHGDYYRSLTGLLRPGILAELSEAAILKARNGEHDTALEIFGILDSLYPRHQAILLNRALVLEAKADARNNGHAEAEAAWEEALSGTQAADRVLSASPPVPGSVYDDTLFYGGLFYYKREDYRKAAELLGFYLTRTEDAENETPNDSESSAEVPDESVTPEAFSRPADSEESPADSAKREKAKEVLGEIKKDSLDDQAFREACELIRNGEEENGILKARDFLERKPQAAKGWFVLGWGLRRLSRWENAAACFEKALELGLDNTDARNECAICLMELGNFDKARKELEKALAADPENIKVISNLAILALKQGKDDEAAAFFRIVLELDPEDPIAGAFFGGMFPA
jgi:tetratricopeptide (TPR) repeat protein